MEIEAFLLCHSAVDREGRLSVLEAFDTLLASEMPVVHPACSVALRLRFEKVEEGNHPVRICIIDRDGKEIGPKIMGDLSVHVGHHMDSVAINLVTNMQKLLFESYGQYRIDLAIDGQIRASLPLKVKETPA